VVLASLTSTQFWAVLGGYVLVCLIAFLVSPRDVYGRKRALGCAFGLFVLGGLIVLGIADAIF
jgi:hypothetical protein